ncbi:flavin reductase [Clostridium butyricum]|uniref:Flavin reductase n=1 Tax=Clostridium butyricum TaxID=1492 RepID=A0A2S7FBS0_CLOBU|nr:flavin reductase [Clostridium butyricum]KHD14013.1 flavin reductase [Clostridium butyricum]PPV15391.1 flavin reductase [Clostridium butyricum]
MNFNKVDLSELDVNPTVEFGKDWLLVMAGTKETGFNAMTIAWCNLGSLFDRKGQRGIPTATIYIRPQRYTKEFIDSNDLFTLVFFPEGYKKQLAYMGAFSGKNVDKVKETGLTPAFGDGFSFFEEASKVLVCRKIYQAPMLEENFIDRTIIEDNYPKKDYHEMYIGEIIQMLVPKK